MSETTTPERPPIRLVVEGRRGCGYRRAGGLYVFSQALLGLGDAMASFADNVVGMGAEMEAWQRHILTALGGDVPARAIRTCRGLPLSVEVCPTCGEGIQPSRNWTWIEPSKLFADCPEHGDDCPLRMPGKHGLLWIGEMYYKTPGEWIEEARTMGVSRRLPLRAGKPCLPRGFKLGETWVFAAHRKAIAEDCRDCNGTGVDPVAEPDEDGDDPDCKVCKGKGRVFRPAIFHAFRPTEMQYVVTGAESDAHLESIRRRGITPIRVTRPQQEMFGVDQSSEQVAACQS